MAEEKKMTLILDVPFYGYDKTKIVSTVSLQFEVPESCGFVDENLVKVDKKLKEVYDFTSRNNQDLDNYNKFAYAVLHILTHVCRYTMSDIRYSVSQCSIMRNIEQYAKHLNTVIRRLDPTTTSSKNVTIISFMDALLALDIISSDVYAMLYLYLYEEGFRSGGKCETTSSTSWIQ